MKIKKILTIILSLSTIVVFAQKSSGTIRDDDEYSIKIIKALEAYAQNNIELNRTIFSEDAILYVNNSKYPYAIAEQGFQSHHTIFNDIQILEPYAHTNYFKRDEIWTNCWYRWMGTGNKTGIRYSNRCHADFKWENGKIVEALYYFDPTGLNLETSEE